MFVIIETIFGTLHALIYVREIKMEGVMRKLILVFITCVLVSGNLFASESLAPEKCSATGASYARTEGKKVDVVPPVKTESKKNVTTVQSV